STLLCFIVDFAPGLCLAEKAGFCGDPSPPSSKVRGVSRRFPIALALFLVSSATGLLYEVAFSKLLAYVFGATAYAVSTVLAAFMGGLALGAHLGGRFAARARRPLAVYGALEIAVGAACAVSP